MVSAQTDDLHKMVAVCITLCKNLEHFKPLKRDLECYNAKRRIEKHERTVNVRYACRVLVTLLSGALT